MASIANEMTASRKTGDLREGALAEDIGYRIALANAAVTRHFSRHMGEALNLRPAEYSVLMLLLSNGPLMPKQLAQSLVLPAPSLTMLIDRLQQRGLVTRVRSDTDRRSQKVLLTADGEALARQAEQASRSMHADIDARLTAGERLMLFELLRKIEELGRR